MELLKEMHKEGFAIAHTKAQINLRTIFQPDKSRGLEVHADAEDFAGNGDKNETQDRDTARSRHGYYFVHGMSDPMEIPTNFREISLMSGHNFSYIKTLHQNHCMGFWGRAVEHRINKELVGSSE